MKLKILMFIVLIIVFSCNNSTQENKKNNFVLQNKIIDSIKVDNSKVIKKKNVTSNNELIKKKGDSLVSEFRTFLNQETDLGGYDTFVTLIYKNKVQNFNIKILWMPYEEAPINHITGPAIIEFKSSVNATRFTITSTDFGLPLDRIGIEYNDRYKIYNTTIKLDYYTTEINNRFDVSIKEPFFFYDVNFDKKKELIYTLIGYGSQNSNMYEAYSLKNDALENDSNQITNERPFSLLSDFTRFNKKDKIIEIDETFGGGKSQTTFYKMITANEFRIISIIKYSFDDKITYKLINNEMQEVSKEKINYLD